MKRSNDQRLSGSWVTLLLPVQEDDSICFSRLAEQIDQLIAMKVSGIYSNGTACEFYNQSEEEFDQISNLLAEKCRASGMPFQIGCSHMSPKLSLERLRRTVHLQPDAVQVILPAWTIPSMQECIRFLTQIQEVAGSIKLVLYNPPHAGKVLKPEEFRQLYDGGISLAGCKVSGGDASWYTRMQTLMPDMALFVPGHTLASGTLLGAAGAFSNVACIHPGAAQEWYHMMHRDSDAALELESRLGLFMRNYIRPFISEQRFSNQAVDKFMAAVGGWTAVGTRLRWPYQAISDTEVARIREAGKAIIPEFIK